MYVSLFIKFFYTNLPIHKSDSLLIFDVYVMDWRCAYSPLEKLPASSIKNWDDNKAHTDKELDECWFSRLQSHTDYDQHIMEASNGRDFGIHESCRKNIKKNRHQVLRLTKK